MKQLWLACLLVGCRLPPVQPPTPTPNDDACQQACDQLERLGCPGHEGSPGRDEQYGTADDVACAQVCRDVEADGISMHTSCVATAADCATVEACSGAP